MTIKARKGKKQVSVILDAAEDALNEAKQCIGNIRSAVDQATFDEEFRRITGDHYEPEQSCEKESLNNMEDYRWLFGDGIIHQSHCPLHNLHNSQEDDLNTSIDSKLHRRECQLHPENNSTSEGLIKLPESEESFNAARITKIHDHPGGGMGSSEESPPLIGVMKSLHIHPK